MERYDVHVCLVSGQPIPNLIPVYDPALRPDRMVLLVTPRMQEEGMGERVKALVESTGCQVDLRPFRAYHMDEIREVVLTILSDYEGKSIALNLTGGTKLMALGAAEVFREMGMPGFYVDTDNRRLIDIHPTMKENPLQDVLKVKPYLTAYGYTVQERGSVQIPQEVQDLTRFLVRHAGRLERGIAAVNYARYNAKKSLWAQVGIRDVSSKEFKEVAQEFKSAGLMDVDGDRVLFRDAVARDFVGGGWLEDYVTSEINRLKGQGRIRDHATNIQVQSGEHSNELDQAFTANNRLHIVECKTQRMDQEEKASAVIYKLKTLQERMGGAFGKAMLVTYRKLNDAERQRLKAYRIRMVEGAQLNNLSSELCQWIEDR